MKKYHIITIGCQMNKSDSERIAYFLENNNLVYEEDRKKADLVVIVTCGIRQSAENRVYGLAPRIKSDNKKTKIILTGCLSERVDVQKKISKYIDLWMPITKLQSLKILDNEIFLEKNKTEDYLKIKAKYNSKFSAFVPIGNGCDNFCTYCVVPYARGREVYRDADLVIKEVQELVSKGYKEITLIAQNVNSYSSSRILSEAKAESKDSEADKVIFNRPFGYRSGSSNSKNVKDESRVNFLDLLKKINAIEGDFYLRFATSHPKDMSYELIQNLPHLNKICEHIHLPAQSGSNKILKAMNRNYTREHYIDLIERIRKTYAKSDLPVAITTDIIVGFPGETVKDFLETYKLFKKIKFDMAYIAQYSVRPGTRAAKLEDDISSEIKKEREEKLMQILRQTSLENNQFYLNKTVEILVEGKNKKGEYFGKTRTGKQTKIINKICEQKDLIGEFVRVQINKVEDFGLSGGLIRF